jgi:cytochrome c5
MGDLPAGSNAEVGGISDIPNPTANMAATSGKPLATLQRGHEIFMLKCGECHYYMMPEKVDIMDWEDTMPEMIRHAGLGRAEEKAVLDYVIAVRAMHGLRD